MKRIIHTIALAAPLATVALSLGATPAMAESVDQPLSKLQAAELGPDIPEDEIPAPEDPERPDDGPGGLSGPEPCPTHGPCGDEPGDKTPPPNPCSTPDDEPSDEDEEDPLPRIKDEKDAGDEDGDEPDEGDIPRPNCIDAGAASTDGGLQLAWLMAGGGLITATGAAYAVRRRTSMGS